MTEEEEHREDCDCPQCERAELRRQFYNDAVGRHPWSRRDG